MNGGPTVNLAPPVIEPRGELLIAGFASKYSNETAKNIPLLWERLQPWLGRVPGQVRERGTTYGVCSNMDRAGNFDYLAGVEVSGVSALPADFAHLRIAPQRYAIFTHRAHVSAIRSVGIAIWTQWLPQSGHEAADAPFLEYYGEDFDGRTGLGGFQIWLPLKA